VVFSKADRDSLLKPLQAVTGIVERRHTLPILSNVLLESKDGQTKLLATDLEIQINTAGPESQAGDFRITTNAKKFQDILRALPDSALVSLDWLRFQVGVTFLLKNAAGWMFIMFKIGQLFLIFKFYIMRF